MQLKRSCESYYPMYSVIPVKTHLLEPIGTLNNFDGLNLKINAPQERASAILR